MILRLTGDGSLMFRDFLIRVSLVSSAIFYAYLIAKVAHESRFERSAKYDSRLTEKNH